MKYGIVFLFTIGCKVMLGQWTEDFSDPQALNNYPSNNWENFIINNNNQLQLNAVTAGFSQAQFPLNTQAENWEFSCFIRQNFAGSANNFGRLLLTINSETDSGGYAESAGAIGLMVQMGEAGSADQFQIFWDDGNQLTPMGEGFNIANGLYGSLKITFDSLLIISFQDNDSSQYYPVYVSDSLNFFSPEYATIQSQYTISNAHNFYWDNLYWGQPWVAEPVVQYAFRSIVINEIMADPTPSVGCPEIEYVELYNTTSDTISLRDWKWVNSSSAQTFPAWEIPPLSYLIVCDQQDIFQWSFPVLGLENFLSLTNSSDSLTLLDATEHLIDQVHYNLDYYHCETIAGGFSLEQIDPTTLCSGLYNWRISHSALGGTPGYPNSVIDTNHGESSVTILDWGIDTNGNIYLWPSLPITQDSIVLKIDDSLSPFPTINYSDSTIILTGNLNHQGKIEIENLNTCHNAQALNFSFEYYAPIDTNVGCWLQEILFHPQDNCPSFVEIFNPHNLAISLDNWSIGNAKDGNVDLQNHHHFIPPKGILALTANPEKVKSFFPQTNLSQAQIHAMKKMPYFTQSNGEVELFYLADRKDHFAYREEMHNPGLDDYIGKSLEKISPNDEFSQWITSS